MKVTADIIPILLEHGISSYEPYEEDSMVFRSLHGRYINIPYNNLELLQLLLDRGASPNQLIQLILLNNSIAVQSIMKSLNCCFVKEPTLIRLTIKDRL